MPFYIGQYDHTCNKEYWHRINPVPVISKFASSKSGLWQITSEDILSMLGKKPNLELILVQREDKPEEICFRVRKFIGYTHQNNESWWAPVVIVSDTNSEDKKPVCTFVYLVDKHPSFFAMSGSYGPNIWPDALKALCKECNQVIRRFK
ncbi:hypothetical protein [Thermovibrio sp.]